MSEYSYRKQSATVMAFAAGTGGIAQAVVSNPLRVWKNQLQLGHACDPWHKQLFGAQSFTGMGLSCSTTVLSNAWCYTAQQWVRQALVARDVRPDVASSLAGVAAGATEVLLTNPLRRVLVMQQASGAQPMDVAVALRRMAHHEGLRGLYAGAGVSAVRNGVACGLFFPLAAALRGPPDKASFKDDLAAAVIASAAATALGQPLDAVISRMQGSTKRVTAAAAARAIFEKHGPQGLLRGTLPNVAQAVPGTAAGFVTTMALVRILLPPNGAWDDAEVTHSGNT